MDPCYFLFDNSDSNEIPFDVSDFATLDGEEVDFTYGELITGEKDQYFYTVGPNVHEEVMIRDGGGSSKASKRRTARYATPMSAFRVKSDTEVLDDGFKWRKYGKKIVKDNPNLRNYYRCSHDGCFVKKRVQRDQSDSSYVITTYEGNHNHPAPSMAISCRRPSSYYRP